MKIATLRIDDVRTHRCGGQAGRVRTHIAGAIRSIVATLAVTALGALTPLVLAGAAQATPIEAGIQAGETAIYDFDLTGQPVQPPYTLFVDADFTLKTLAQVPSLVTLTFFADLDGRGAALFSEQQSVRIIDLNLVRTNPEALDGVFSVALTVDSGAIEVLSAQASAFNDAGGVPVATVDGIAVPEPSSFALLATALLGLAWCRHLGRKATVKRAVIALGAAVALGAGTAAAAPITIDYSFTADSIGPGFAPFGIASVPAGPFAATVTFDGPLPPNEVLNFAIEPTPPITGTAVLGNYTFAQPVIDTLITDAAGHLAALLVDFIDQHAVLALAIGLDPLHQPGTHWAAFDGRFLAGCGPFDDPPFAVTTGPCIGGDTSTMSFTVTDANAVPEPPMLLIVGLALACLALALARRRASRRAPALQA